MNFGSKCALHDDSAEEEVVGEADMAAGLLGAPNPPAQAATAVGSVLPPTPPQPRAAGTAAALLGARTWTRKIDTNILNVDMAALSDEAPYATGDPTLCPGCQACLSAVSILTPVSTADDNGGSSDDVYDWSCEYCHMVNRVQLDGMEKPVDGVLSVDYLIEGPPAAAAGKAGTGGAAGAAPSAADTTKGTGKGKGKGRGSGKAKEDNSAVLFVIDTSGSMGQTTAVDGRLKLRGAEEVSLLKRKQMHRDGKTHVTRLQFMQAAVDHQLETMTQETPSRCAGLVTFASSVSVIGDATTTPAEDAHDGGGGGGGDMYGERLSDQKALRKMGRASGPLLSRPVSESRAKLTERLFALKPRGGTALGPAVVAGLSMLKERDGGGSRLVLCTDGQANVGLGALNSMSNTQQREAVETFYENLGHESKEIGVTIDVVSVDSESCDLENLGAMADISGGTVGKVSASELTSNFAGILANPILASQVTVRVILHKGLMFRNADDVGTDTSTFTANLGNVTRETELNFEYQVRDKAERVALGLHDNDNGTLFSPTVRPPLPASGAATPATAQGFLPFQVQLRYTRLDGTKCLRVLTNTQPVTTNKAEAERTLSMEIVAGHAASQAGNMASKGAYQSTRVSLRAWSHLMRRNATTPESQAQVQRYASEMTALDNEVVRAQSSESFVQDRGGSMNYAMESAQHGRSRKTARSGNDGLSHSAYVSKAAHFKASKRNTKGQ